MSRAFLAQALTANGIAVGGLSDVGFDPSYANVVTSSGDGAVGSEDVDRVGLSVACNINCSDVTKAAAILDATPGVTQLYGQEAGGSLYQRVTVSNIILASMNMNIGDTGDGTLALSGQVRLADGTTDVDDVLGILAGQTAPTNTYPARLFRPHSASFDPDGAPPAITPLHVKSISLALSAEIFSDFGDDDIGMVAVDRGPFGPLEVTLVHKDVSASGTSSKQAAILAADRGVLTVTLKGRAGAANKVLTINNLLWTGGSKRMGREHWEYTLTGRCGWRNGATVYLLNSAPQLFAFV